MVRDLNNTAFASFMNGRGRNVIDNIIIVNKIMPVSIHVSAQANKDLEETAYHSQFVVNSNSMGYAAGKDDDRPERITKSFIASTSAYLSKNKIAKTDEAVALVLQDVSGNFKFAGIVEYHENDENPDEPGNWSYVMTFNEDDLKELEKTKTVKKLKYGDDPFRTVMDKVSYDIGGIQFQQERYMYDACLLVVDTIVQVLDSEAVPGETVDIDMPGYFKASVSVENDEKIFSITPDGHQKSIIKDDGALEV